MENETSSEQNHTYLLKIFATFMSIAAAILCFMIFIYWKGYADNLGINTNSMDISYKENIYTILLASPNLIILFVSSLFISKLFSHKQINKEIIKKICLIVFITFLLNMYILYCYNSFQFNIRFMFSLLIIYSIVANWYFFNSFNAFTKKSKPLSDYIIDSFNRIRSAICLQCRV